MSEESTEDLFPEKTEEEKIAEVHEKLKAKGIEIPEEVSTVAENATLDPIEEEARKKGWDPSKGSKTAQQFLDAEPYIEEIKARGKEIKELKRTVDEIAKHMEVERKKGYRQAIEDLKRQRSDAIALGDEKAVNAIEYQMKNYDMEDRPAPEPVRSGPTPEEISQLPAVQEFVQRHKSWIEDNISLEAIEIKKFAAERDEYLTKLGLDPEKEVAILEQDLYKKFPNYFNKGNDGYSATVSDSVSTGKVTSKTKFTFKDLNKAQQSACRHFIKCNLYQNEQGYINDLVKAGDLK